jgi:chromosome segregation protein
MLSLALVGGDEPLVIDQPEDDLDNRFVYEEVVQLLASVSSGRQVIVATHNANIPVLGDAELIMAFDAGAGRAFTLCCGGLDEPGVADTARRILEGGDDAFKARARRYEVRGGWHSALISAEQNAYLSLHSFLLNADPGDWRWDLHRRRDKVDLLT